MDPSAANFQPSAPIKAVSIDNDAIKWVDSHPPAPTKPIASKPSVATPPDEVDWKMKVHNGLEGVIVTETEISTVGIPTIGLTYRGFPISQLIHSASFEEVAYILISGNTPNSGKIREFKTKIAQGRNLSLQAKALCELFGPSADPMDVIRTVVSYAPTSGRIDINDNVLNMAGFLLGYLPSCVAYWWNFSQTGRRIDTCGDTGMGVARHFLLCLNQADPTYLSEHSLDKSLIGYAEHDLNASTFSARVTASTLADYHGAITAAIATLKGPLHGGANRAALEMLETFESIDDVVPRLTEMLARKEKIMGFGHRVYKNGDPRHFIFKDLALALSDDPANLYRNPGLVTIASKLEVEMVNRKNIHPNLDFFASVVYKQIGIPKELFTVLFAIGRTAGWTAHIKAQLDNNKLIRPKAKYTGPETRNFVSRC